MRKAKLYKIFGWAVFAVYLCVLLEITVFRHDFLENPPFTNGSIKLVPFAGYADILSRRRYLSFIYLFGGNIAWFIPFGFLLPYLAGRAKPPQTAAIYGFLLSLAIELSQFAFGTGQSEVDDLLLNTLGAVLGGLLLKAYIKRRDKKRGITNEDMK
ncbi:VanZ like family protein [Sporobacter termitidis DSM 10068]|uniref:VanZ like family protein n=1 Tax=Sporobacter termitidis DSM 10068 TaxID=1123282 RepID=A0A1M5ZH99_9FIRM|nr:VanZ family protein [Sporobacter termitidis]SHI23568.1 VanZ like family protein [Sporobacter termitidis DSM 10068]